MKSGTIALVGRPNAGKSSLLNAILGQDLSIVSPKAQTTRDQILGVYTEDKKGQILFYDTPGIHFAKPGGINEAMMANVSQALEAPDLVWLLLDPHSDLKREERLFQYLKENLQGVPVFLVFTKADQKRTLNDRDLMDWAKAQMDYAGVFEVSSIKSKKGLGTLVDSSWEKLPEGAPFFDDPDQISDRPMRFFAAEFIREQLFLHLGQELPYACAVKIVEFSEKKKPILIRAEICVERESQKGMVIGAGAQKIKQIGIDARKRLEGFMEQPIALKLQVEVIKDWSKNVDRLRELGYNVPQKKK